MKMILISTPGVSSVNAIPVSFFIHLPWFMTSHLSRNAETVFASDFIHQVFLTFFPFLLPANKFTT